MPATTPLGVPKVALVVARLIIEGVDQGSRTFIVPICNEREMYKGVISLPLPPRSGTCPFDFSFTRFEDVHLPRSALLGSLSPIKASYSRELWWQEVAALQRGTLAISAPFISGIKIAGYVGGLYSLRRKILGKETIPRPIISFRTQQWPVLQAIAVGRVLEAWYPEAIHHLQDSNSDPRIRHAISVIFKTVSIRHFQLCNSQMMERLGAIGMFPFNDLSRIDVGLSLR